MKNIIATLMCLTSFSAFSGAFVKVDEARKTITLTANIKYYGKDAKKENAAACTQDIIREWAPLSQNQTVELGTKNNLLEAKYKIQLVVNHEVITTAKANSGIKNRKSVADNFIEIPRDPAEDRMNAGGNVYNDGFTGSIYNDGIQVDFKICAHEFGHLLGLGEMNDPSTPPSLMTQGGIKTPYEAYQVKVWDPRFFNMDVGTFDVRKRKISNREMEEIKRGLQYLSFQNGEAALNCRTCY